MLLRIEEAIFLCCRQSYGASVHSAGLFVPDGACAARSALLHELACLSSGRIAQTVHMQVKFLKADIDTPALEKTVSDNGIASVVRSRTAMQCGWHATAQHTLHPSWPYLHPSTAVQPTFVFIKDGQQRSKVSGADPQQLVKVLDELTQSAT